MKRSLSLLGVPVRLFLDGASGHESKPLLYRWTVYNYDKEVMIYVGKARRGLDRPLKTYRKVVEDLHLNRGVKTVCLEPKPHYFRRNVWGYRWVHHELERYADAIRNGESRYSIELKIIEPNVPNDLLNSAERTAINAAKARFQDLGVVANDVPCMDKNRSRIDTVWTCGCITCQTGA